MSRRNLAVLVFVVVFAAYSVAAAAQEVIDFEDLPAGTVVAEVFGDLGSGPIVVEGINPNLDDNAAVVFDSTDPTGGDDDLGTPNEDFGGPGMGEGGELGAEFQNDQEQGNLLIVAEDLEDADGDGLIDDPDDADSANASIRFDFSELGSVEVSAITLIDVEANEPNASVEFFDDMGNSIAIFELPQVGDNGLAEVDLGPTSGVGEMVVSLNGSGAIDDIVFTPECALSLTVDRDDLARGETLAIDLSLIHRGDTVHVPFSMWIENAAGDVLYQRTTAVREMRHGDTIDYETVFDVPSDFAPGDYWLVVGTRKMKQGIEWARRQFVVTE